LVPEQALFQVQVPVPAADHDHESNYETGKNESFADDSTTCTYFAYEDLFRLKQILIKFASISGLRCNFEKTSIMRIGNLDGDVDERIAELGFEIVDKCKLLGFIFSRDSPLASANAPQLIEKIKNTIRFWTPFNLSIAGKVTVAKSLILPLFIYYGTVINFSFEQLAEMEGAIERYVIRGINIAKNKIYEDTGTGGIGLFRLADFAMTLQSYWIKRVMTSAHDNWRKKIVEISNGSPFNIAAPTDDSTGPELTGIIKNFVTFRNRYGTIGNNYMTVPIFGNDFFFYKEEREKKHFDLNFFAGIDNIARVKVLSWSDITNNTNLLKSREEIAQTTAIQLTEDQHSKLKAGLKNAYKQYFSEGDKTVPVQQFLLGIKKGTKKFRCILRKTKDSSKKIKTPIDNYVNIAGIELTDPDLAIKLNRNWTRHYLCSEFKTFLFKLYHNVLGVNSRVHHYNPDRGPECGFCIKKLNLPAERETIKHFFWYCPTANQSIIALTGELINFVPSQSNFFLGTDNMGAYNDALMLIFDLIKFILWQHKLRKKLPTNHSMRGDFVYFWGIFLGSNKKLKTAVTNSNFVRRYNGEDV
jgi:hypothetical protein